MIVQCDDDLYRVDRVFLGPRGRPWPFRITYRAYGFWAGLTVVEVVLWRMLRLPWSVVVFAALATAAYFGAKWLDRHLTADRPIPAEIVRVWQELVAPRPALKPAPSAVSVPVVVERWRAGARSERWLVRTASAVTAGWSRFVAKLTGHQRGRIYINGGWKDVR